jgi:phosphate butyryltransferase
MPSMETIDFSSIEPLRDMRSLVSLAKLIGQVRGFKRVAVAAAEDDHVLEAIHNARLEGMIHPILFGNEAKIKAVCLEIGIDASKLEIHHAASNAEASELAVKAVREGRADILMKGLVDTATILRAVLNKEWGLRTGKLLSHILVFDAPNKFERLFCMSDGAMNIEPDLKAKIEIVQNAVAVSIALGLLKWGIVGRLKAQPLMVLWHLITRSRQRLPKLRELFRL